MVLTESFMLELGIEMPQFTLPNFNPAIAADMVSSSDFDRAPATLVTFICNHCPYVVHLKGALSVFAKEYYDRGLAVAAINSNDADRYPADSPENMTDDAERYGYVFPYLFDESQTVANSFSAVCTPEFYLFDSRGTLAYRGQFDGSRPGNGVAITGEDLRAAADALLSGGQVVTHQLPSVGCSIKWKPDAAERG